MKAFLTEWLIRYGTGWDDVTCRIVSENIWAWAAANRDGYLEHNTKQKGPYTEYRITTKGLEYLKDERISD